MTSIEDAFWYLADVQGVELLAHCRQVKLEWEHECVRLLEGIEIDGPELVLDFLLLLLAC